MAKDIQDRELLEAILRELCEIRDIVDEYLILRPQIKEIIANKHTPPERRTEGQQLLDRLDMERRESRKRSSHLEETVQCAECGKKFEVVGEDNGKPKAWQEIPCTHFPCDGTAKAFWPEGANFQTRKIDPQM